jgi:hypothetical protein
VGVHVDDLLVTSDEAEGVTYVEDLLRNAFENINVSYDSVDYLGMRIAKKAKRIEVTMSGYVEDCIKKGEREGKLREYASQAVSELFESDDTPKLSVEKSDEFHSYVAKLLYVAKRVRPDILTATTYLCSRVSEPTTRDWEHLVHLLGYVKRTKHYCLAFYVGATGRDHCIR